MLLAAALASRHTRMGHVCFDLNIMAAFGYERGCPGCVSAAGRVAQPALDVRLRWRARRNKAADSGCSAIDCICTGCTAGSRIWRSICCARAAQTTMPEDAGAFTQSFARLFPAGTDARLRLAAFSAAVKPLCIICGGPGTGKTTTAARILALLLEQRGQGQRIALAAPTGKAADRLQKAVAGALDALPADAEVLERHTP